ncbi:MAG: hypothetical protein E7Z80_04620 [Methanobrevibacter thaueri]|nr:hypothetical protein [Methanobrevibacter thaueri]
MDAMEVVAVIILVLAIAILVYYYLLNSPATMDKLRNYVPTSADAHMNRVLNNNSDYDLSKEEPDESESGSVSKRIKVKLSDIDMSSLNTDAFSHKIDTFLDAKSEELIKDWSLATTDDLEELENKFSKTTESVDDLEKSFNEFKKTSEEFQKSTQDKLNDLDSRISALEK